MKTYKEKLTSLLCQVDEIKKQIMELSFGCEILISGKICRITNISEGFTTTHFLVNYTNEEKKEEEEEVEKIIGNPLEYHHLDMYCRAYHINIIKNSYGEYQSIDRTPLFIIDITKDFNNQTEELYKKIFIFLNKIK